MTFAADTRLARLLQLASPSLPVGAYSYSQGLEAAVDAGIVRDAASTTCWIAEVLEHSVARMEAPVLLRLIAAWRSGDSEGVTWWNSLLLASRESAELRAEAVQMGYSLARLVKELDHGDGLDGIDEISFSAVFAYAVAKWEIDAPAALVAYLWAWLENQVIGGREGDPTGSDRRPAHPVIPRRTTGVNSRARGRGDRRRSRQLCPRLAILSSRHETQYSRLFQFLDLELF